MIIESTRLGKLDIEDHNVIQFPHGIPGFPDEKEFVLLPCEPDSPFAYMQAVAEPNLTFLVVEPFTFFNDYEFTLDDQITDDLKLSDEKLPQIFNIVTVPEKAEEMTVNLLAPIVMNLHDRIAQQVVLEKVPFTTRHRLFPSGFPEADRKGGR
jgi:flagellar assembly factor FliW